MGHSEFWSGFRVGHSEFWSGFRVGQVVLYTRTCTISICMPPSAQWDTFILSCYTQSLIGVQCSIRWRDGMLQHASLVGMPTAISA